VQPEVLAEELSGMKLLRFTLRNLMVVTAICAVVLFVAQEFREGMPPRSAVRGIPARIARLKPGMTFRQVHDILGLEKSWFKGGTDAKCLLAQEDGPVYHLVYSVRPASRVAGTPHVKGITTSLGVYRSHAMVEIWFDLVASPRRDGGRKLRATCLAHVSFSSDGETIAEMPDGR
jgi:hypothetical protein